MTASSSGFLLAAVPLFAAMVGGQTPGQQPTPIAEGVIDLAQERVLFPATVHGDTTSLILDLGTTTNLISRAEATRLKIPGAADESQGTVQLDSLRIGSSTRYDLELQVTDGGFGGAHILMGAPFQADYDLVFDGPSRRARLYAQPKTGGPGPNGAKRPVWFPQGVAPTDCVAMTGDQDGFQRVFFPLELNGHPVHSMFDSGTSSTNVNVYGARQGGLTLASGHVHPITGAIGYLGPYPAVWEGVPALMTINGRPMAEDSVSIFRHIPREKQGPGIQDGELSLGLRAVRDRTMYISYSTNQFCLGAPAMQSAAKHN